VVKKVEKKEATSIYYYTHARFRCTRTRRARFGFFLFDDVKILVVGSKSILFLHKSVPRSLARVK